MTIGSLIGGMAHNKNPALTQLGALGAQMQQQKGAAKATVAALRKEGTPKALQAAALIEAQPSNAKAIAQAYYANKLKPAPETFTQGTLPDGTPIDINQVTGRRHGVSGGGGTNVSVTNKLPASIPDADKGYQYRRNPDGSLYIDEQGRAVQLETPGGKAERERLEMEEKAARLSGQQSAAATTVVEDLDRMDAMVDDLFDADSEVGRIASGLATTMAQEVPRSRTNQMGKFKESVLSNVGIDQLMQMKFNSPTGGALGQVPFQQQQRLEQLLGSLDLVQDPAVIRDNIARIKQHYLSVIHGTQAERDALLLSGDVTQAQYDQVQKLFDEATPSFREGAGTGAPAWWDNSRMDWDSLPESEKRRALSMGG
jgi:hypothetical protein